MSDIHSRTGLEPMEVARTLLDTLKKYDAARTQADILGRSIIDINPLMLNALETVVWFFDTINNNFANKNSFTRYLKENC